MAVLTTAGRKRIKAKSFALSGRRYPIHDKRHAANALARVTQHGTPEEQAKVRRAVMRKYPSLKAGVLKKHPGLAKRAAKGLSKASKK